MSALTQDQKDQFWRDGVLVVEDAVTPEELESLRTVFAGWVEESRGHDDDYGDTLDGRARFDLEPGHSAEQPALRRVQSPEEVSDVYADVMRIVRDASFQDLESFPLLKRLKEHRETITTLTFDGSGDYLASGSADDRLIIWEVASGEDLLTFHQGNEYDVTTCAFSHDGKRLVYDNKEAWEADVKKLEIAAGRATAEPAPAPTPQPAPAPNNP